MNDKEIDDLVEILKKIFGERVSKERVKAGFPTQEKAAAALKVSRAALKELERGANGPSLRMIAKLCVVFGVGPAVFFSFFLIGVDADDRENELDRIIVAAAHLGLDDLVTLRVCAEALEEHRRSEAAESGS